METNNLKFSGHESFHCRQFWLKKGYDHFKSGKSFNDQAVFDLGVGRNMVGSIRFWLRAFDIISDNDELTDIAQCIFEDNGWDPYLEDEATLWLLHYKLSSKKYASIYNLIFSEIRKTRPEFSKNHIISKVYDLDASQSDKSVEKDFSVFVRNYFAKQSGDKEESFSGLFSELELMNEVGEDNQKNQLYNICNRKQETIPWQIILYCILQNQEYGDSISVKAMMASDGVATLFALTPQNLESKLIEISENLKGVVYKNDAGVKELQFKENKPNGTEILNSYYLNEK